MGEGAVGTRGLSLIQGVIISGINLLGHDRSQSVNRLLILQLKPSLETIRSFSPLTLSDGIIFIFRILDLILTLLSQLLLLLLEQPLSKRALKGVALEVFGGKWGCSNLRMA